MNQVTVKHEVSPVSVLNELEDMKKLAAGLMKAKHYEKLGEVGVFAVIQKAKSLGMHPIEALNGALYYVNGKVELSGQRMLALIRSHGHSVQMDPKSTETCVIMHGKRRDNGDTWTVSFSIEDAKRAGIYKQTWEKFPKTMCSWRCVSLLGRFLFSDLLADCYVEGELEEAIPMEERKESNDAMEVVATPMETITPEQLLTLQEAIGNDLSFREKVLKFYHIESLSELNPVQYQLVLERAQNKSKEEVVA
jgi:hypothetical protein